MQQRYEYKFVRVRLRSGFWSGEVKADYQEVIHEHAREGWRLVTLFAPAVPGYADLVFEKPRG